MTELNLEKLQNVLKKSPGIKAKEIGRILRADYKLNMDKSEINSILYGHKELFIVDKNYCWKLKVEPTYVTKETGLVVEGTITNIAIPKMGKTGTRAWTKQDVQVKDKVNSEIITATVWNNKIDLKSINVGLSVKMGFTIKQKNKTGISYKEVLEIKVIDNNSEDLPF